MSFAANRDFFAMNWNLYRCLLWLSVRQYRLKRVQIRDSGCLIETETAVPELDIISLDGDPYARATLNECQVIWRQYPKKDEA